MLRGDLEAVIFDWAGTTVDFGSVAPAAAFVTLFAEAGVPVSVEEARRPMGIHKRVHIQTLLADPGIRARWRAARGSEPGEADVDRLFAAFVPLQLAAITRHAALVPGTLETVAALRARGVRIGSTTGYTREMLEVAARAAAEQGYVPDAMVCVSDVSAGRPGPAMALRNVLELGVGRVDACVKVDDTVAGIHEGLRAGMWTVGVAVSGNGVGLTLDEWRATPRDRQRRLRAAAVEQLRAAGAHAVIDSVAELVPCIDRLRSTTKARARRAASA